MIAFRFALIGVALVATAQQRPVNFYSVQKEAEMGAQQARQVASQTTPIEIPEVRAYLDRVTAELARQIPDSPFQFSVAMVKEGGAKPLVLPGGYMFVSAGLFTAVQSESEFAGVLARAMADVARRTATLMLSRGEMNQIAVQPLIFMEGWQGYAVRQGMSSAIPQGTQLVRRRMEMDSDAMAVRIMASGGYDPSALAEFVSRTGKDDGSAGWNDFQQRRLAALRTTSPATLHVDSADFARIRDLLAK